MRRRTVSFLWGILSLFFVRSTVLSQATGVQASATAAADIIGTWVGEAQVPRLGYFELRIEPTDPTSAALDMPLKNQWDMPVRVIPLLPEYRFSLPLSERDTAEFAGTLHGGTLTGTVRLSGITGRFAANRVRRDVAAADSLSGNYVMRNGDAISVGATDRGYAFFFDSRSNRVGRLEQQNDSVWTVGPGLGIAFPFLAVIHTERDSDRRLTRIRWSENGRVFTARRRNDYTTVPLSFANGQIHLAGELLLPKSQGRHKTVVLLHGSGPESHRDFHWLRYYLAGHGIAVVSYDKRGVGSSAGDWRSASFEELASDALAAARAVRTRGDIDSLRLGVLGWSNGGWVAPLAMANREFAFAAVGAAPGTASGDNIAFEVAKDLEDAGFDKDEVSEGVAIRQYVTHFVVDRPAITAAAWDSLRAVVAGKSKARWFSRARIGWVLNVAPPPDTATLGLLRGMTKQWTLDPVPGWASIHVPVFVMLGANDNAVPATQSAERLRFAFHQAGNCRAAVKLYPNGSHALFWVRSLSQADVESATHYVQGFPSDLTRWLNTTTMASARKCRAGGTD